MTADPDQYAPESASYCRYEECVNETAHSPGEILAPHRQQTIERMKTYETVVCALSVIDCDELQKFDGDERPRTVSSLLYATIAWSTGGIPLGVLRCTYSTKSKRVNTELWRGILRDIDNAARTMPPETRVMCAMDWSADIYDLFAMQRGLERTELLLRASHNPRPRQKQERLFKAMRNCPLVGEVKLYASRTDTAESASDDVVANTPILFEVRRRIIAISPSIPNAGALVRVSTVFLREKAPPDGVDGIEFYFATTAALDSLENVRKLAECYEPVLYSEMIVRFLKSGCRTDELRIEHASMFHRALTLYLVAAWRVYLIAVLGIARSETDPDVIFTDEELEVLSEYAHTHDFEFDNLASALQIMGEMGARTAEEYERLTMHEMLWRGYKLIQFHATIDDESDQVWDFFWDPPAAPGA